jgi:uncharacterized protein YcbX
VSSSPGKVASLYRYPVKGLSPEALEHVQLAPGAAFPADRIIALALRDGQFDPQQPARLLDKSNYLMLRRDDRLATLRTVFDEETNRLRISNHDRGQAVLDVDVSQPAGAAAVEHFFAEMFGLASPPILARAEPFRFTDVEPQCVSFINLASVRDLGEKIGQAVDPLRFRANVYFDEWPPFGEMSLHPGSRLQVGEIEFEVVDMTGRCAATEVNPATAKRDLRIPALLRKHYGHCDMGFYVRVRGTGTLRRGDIIARL